MNCGTASSFWIQNYSFYIAFKISSRNDKAKKRYESAYSECESLTYHYRMNCQKVITKNLKESVDNNLELFLKIEELRFVKMIKTSLIYLIFFHFKLADAIKIRLLTL